MILVFGKTGQVGEELQRLGGVIVLGRDQADLSNPSFCADAIYAYAPSAVINAAAYTAVDLAEEEETLATIINGYAPISMAQACVALNIPFVHISTDYVFEGSGDNSWHTTDATDPQNAYGRSKLIAEDGIRASGATHAILRTSWVISAFGTNFVKTMLQLSKTRNELSIVGDQIGSPTPAKDIAIACLRIAKYLQIDQTKSGTYHFSGTPNVSWADFATEIFCQTDCSIKINPILSVDYPTLACRPLNSRLDCGKTQNIFNIPRPDWRVGLKLILEQLEVFHEKS